MHSGREGSGCVGQASCLPHTPAILLPQQQRCTHKPEAPAPGRSRRWRFGLVYPGAGASGLCHRTIPRSTLVLVGQPRGIAQGGGDLPHLRFRPSREQDVRRIAVVAVQRYAIGDLVKGEIPPEDSGNDARDEQAETNEIIPERDVPMDAAADAFMNPLCSRSSLSARGAHRMLTA